jgi:hypothetical protein
MALLSHARLPPMCYGRVMPDRSTSPAVGFTTLERDLIRREFCQHFGSYPLVAEGIFLRTWRGGPQAGEPKLPPAVRQCLNAAYWRFGATGDWFAPILPRPASWPCGNSLPIAAISTRCVMPIYGVNWAWRLRKTQHHPLINDE